MSRYKSFGLGKHKRPLNYAITALTRLEFHHLCPLERNQQSTINLPQLHFHTMENTTSGMAIPLKLTIFCHDAFEDNGRCPGKHWDKESVFVLPLPSGTETSMLQVSEQIKIILEERKFSRRYHPSDNSFENHQLHSFSLGVDWETKDMNYTALGYVYLIDNGEYGYGPSIMAEKFDTGLRSALQALATRGWRGHLEMSCTVIAG